MRFLTPLVLSMVVAVPLFGVTGDLAVSSFTSSKPAVTTGERFTLNVRVRNGGPDTVPMLVTLNQTQPGLYLEVNAPAEWRCTDPVRFAESVSCFTGPLNAGEEQEMNATVLAPRSIIAAAGEYTITARATGAFDEPDFTNNSRTLTLGLQPSTANADLMLTATSTTTVLPGTPVDLTFTASNLGPADANNALLRFFTGGIDVDDFTFTGNGWTCGATSDREVACQRNVLRSGETAPLVVQFVAVDETIVSLNGSLTAEEIHDADSLNNFAPVRVGVGSEASWQRFLVPVTATEIPGAFGSLWKTDVTMLFLADDRPDVRPDPCEGSPTDCFVPTPPLRRPFDAREHGFIRTAPQDPGGQFLYVRTGDIDEVRLNARVFDLSRETETAGSEIPIVRENAFTSEILAMLNVPVAPQFRYRLRVYDAEGADGTAAIIRVYANDDQEPKATVVRELRLPPDAGTTTSVLLPTRPAYLDLDLASVTSLDGLESIRVEVEPVAAQTKLWAFVTITNNDTHHVTIVSPQ